MNRDKVTFAFGCNYILHRVFLYKYKLIANATLFQIITLITSELMGDIPEKCDFWSIWHII
jgi:hypothetical protein